MAYTKYSLTPANNNAAPPNGAPEGMLPSAVNDTMRDMMAQIRDCGDGIRDGTYTMTAPKITGGTITGVTLTGNTFSNPTITGVSTFAAGTVSAPAITTTGDTNTGIFFPAADTIAFTEGGAEAMRIDSSGNVGIGVSPATRFHTQGGRVRIDANSENFALQLNNSTTANGCFLGSAGADTFVISTSSGAERMRITSDGNLLVNTSTARTNFFNSTSSPFVQVEGTTFATSSYSTVRNSNDNAAPFLILAKSRGTTVGSNTVVNDADQLGALSFQGNDGTEFVDAARITASVDGTPGANDMPGRLAFFTTADGASTLTERMRIDSSGNVGIGTSSPAVPLDVQAASSGGNGLQIRGRSSDGIAYMRFSNNAANAFAYIGSTAGTNMYFEANGSERMRITSDGNLLLGTTADQNAARLRVVGGSTSGTNYTLLVEGSGGADNFYVRDDGEMYSLPTYNRTSAGASNVGVDAAGGFFRSTSSIKYKTDVQDATHGLAEVLQLRSVTYKGKNDGDTVFGGLIAEEVDAIGLTEFVQYAEDGSPDALAYGNMVSLLAKAIQQQQAMIEELKQEVAALKAK